MFLFLNNGTQEQSKNIKEVMMKLLKATIVSASVLLLSACGEVYDGTYTLMGKDKSEIELSGNAGEITIEQKGDEMSVDVEVTDYHRDELGNPKSLTLVLDMGERSRTMEAEFINNDFFRVGRELYVKDGANKFAALEDFKGSYTHDFGKIITTVEINDSSVVVTDTVVKTGKVKEVFNETIDGLIKVEEKDVPALFLLSNKTGLLKRLPIIEIVDEHHLKIKGKKYSNLAKITKA